MRYFSFIALGLVAACGSPESKTTGDDLSSADVGEVALEISNVPAGALCVQIVATGTTTVTKQFAVTAGSSSASLALGQLALGSNSLAGQAYNVACASIGTATPTWIADSTTVSVVPGVIPSVKMTFRPYNAAVANANFVGNVTSLHASMYFMAATLSDGSVRAAGINQLFNSQTFAVVPTLTNVKQTAGGGNYAAACALLNTGTVQCWGSNNVGQLGTNGTPTFSATPIAVPGLTTVAQLVGGDGHFCARTTVGQVYCWGNNFAGQVGNGTVANVLSPTMVLDSQVSSLTAAPYATCAVAGDQVYCWGYNSNGQLGTGNTTAPTVPTLVPALTAPIQVVLGIAHGCLLRADGTVRCSGINSAGQLGVGNTTASLTPLTVTGLTNIQQIAAADNATCARSATGTVSCWGANSIGQVGDGSGTNRLSPVPLVNLPPSASITGAFLNLCSIGTNAAIHCWGSNNSGQLGNGTLAAGYAPVAIQL